MANRYKNLPNPPSEVECEKYKFLIFEAPNDANLKEYVAELKAQGCKHLVRACVATYADEQLTEAGIKTHELSFPDGSAPTDSVVDEWLKVLTSALEESGGKAATTKPLIAVHCVAGLGRAPVLVAIAMMETGTDANTAIKEIRTRRPGALNIVQLKYLQSYKRRGGKCIVM